MKIFEFLFFAFIFKYVHLNAQLGVEKNSAKPRNLSLLTDILNASTQQNNNINNQSNNFIQDVNQAQNVLNTIKQLGQLSQVNQNSQINNQQQSNNNVASLLQQILKNQQQNIEQQQTTTQTSTRVQTKHKTKPKKLQKQPIIVQKNTQQNNNQKEDFKKNLLQYKYVCLDKKNFCEIGCQKHCNVIEYSKMFAQKNREILKNAEKLNKQEFIQHEKDDCKTCKNDCYSAIADTCVQNENQFKPVSKEAFYTFKLNSKNCQDKGYVCTKICQLDYCQNNFSPECSQCKLDCNEGSLSGCYMSENKYQYINFERVFKDFKRGKSKLKCENCQQETKYYCKNECGSKKFKCKRECIKKANLSCQSQCKGNKDDFYQKQLISKVRNFLRRMKGSCSSCSEICKNEVKVVCNSIDKTCQTQFKKICTTDCLQKYCKRYIRTVRNSRARRLYLQIAFNKFQIIMNRLKAYQKLRRSYDEKLEQEMRYQALLDNRKRASMLLKGTEQNFYSQLQQNYEEDQRKSEEYEMNFMLKLEQHLKTPEKYKEIEGTVYDVFSD